MTRSTPQVLSSAIGRQLTFGGEVPSNTVFTDDTGKSTSVEFVEPKWNHDDSVSLALAGIISRPMATTNVMKRPLVASLKPNSHPRYRSRATVG